MSYTQVTITGYNSGPPADDGSQGPSNLISWSAIKTKLFDPIKSGLETIDDNIATASATLDTTLATLQSGVSSASANVTALLTALNAPSGTSMLFKQSAAPTGWTKGTSFDDYALRLVTGTASSGGSTAFSSVFASRTITSANLPAHTHTFSDNLRTVSFAGTTTFVYDLGFTTNGILNGGGSSAKDSVNNVNVTVTGSFDISTTSSTAGSGGGWDFAVQYVDVIYATKN